MSTRPTAKGISAINPFNELFGVHFLEGKPLEEFHINKRDRTLYLRLVEAEKDGLITLTLNPPRFDTNSTGDLFVIYWVIYWVV